MTKKLFARLALVAVLTLAAAAPIATATDWPIPQCWPNCMDR